MTVGLIWAEAANGVIGRDNAIPWHIPEDMANFRAVTRGATVVMGRRTWQSLPPRFRPLPGRRNVVLTRDESWAAEGAQVAHTLQQALALADGDDVWVIGGAQVYAESMPVADRAVITRLREPVEGDTVAPRLDSRWREVGDTGWLTSAAGAVYRICEYSAES